MTDGLDELERIAGGMLRALSPARRRAILRHMAADLARRNRSRIAAQQQPDGSPFTPRKPKPAPVTGRGTACFLYPSAGTGEPRRVIMKSFAWGQGRMMTGFDIEAGAIRSFDFAKVIKWLPVPADHRNQGGGTLRRRGGLKRKAMFRRLATARYLRAQADDTGFWVGFSGKASQVASIHHGGLRDRPSLRSNAMDYPRRELLGANADDRDSMIELLWQHLID